MKRRRGHIKSAVFVLVALVTSSYIILPVFGPKRGFEALKIHDYFKARKVFLKKVKSHPIAANYGLSVITQRANNPFHNLDSAYLYIERSASSFGLAPMKKRVNANKFRIDSAAIAEQTNRVRSSAWNVANQSSTEDAYNHYIDHYGKSAFADSAVQARNALVFEGVRNVDTPDAYRNFLRTYPNAEEAIEAQGRLDAAIYRAYTASGSIAAYLRYINDFPENNYANNAQDKIYELSAADGSAEAYFGFINKFPANKNVKKAWRQLYAVETRGAGVRSIEQFKKAYPAYPFISELSVDIETANRPLYPFVESNGWGFIDEQGIERIAPQFAWVDAFEGPTAIVSKNGKVGTIDRSGATVIPFLFDDVEIVGEEVAIAVKNGLSGMVDRLGNTIIDFEYDHLSLPQEGLLIAEKDEKFGYLSITGAVVIPFDYELAEAFIGGRAVVKRDGKYGMINLQGATVIPFNYDFLEAFDGGFARARSAEKFLLLNTFGNELQSEAFVKIGKFSERTKLAYAITPDLKAGYLDTTGQLVIDAIYDGEQALTESLNFTENYAAVRKPQGKLGLIDTRGKQVLPFQYLWMGEISEGIVAVEKKKGKRYYVNIEEYARISPVEFRLTWPFEAGYALAKTDSNYCVLLKRDGTVLSFDNAEELSYFKHELIVVGKKGNYGLRTINNELLLPSVYDVCEPLSERLWKVVLNEKVAYYRSDLKKFIWIQEGFPVLMN